MVIYRHEHKAEISYFDYLLLRSRLACVLSPDSHTGPADAYTIHSLYFDTLNDKALREKEDGVSRREKFRIRYYNNDLSYIRLEKKMKIGNVGTKYSAPLTANETEYILSGETAWMAGSHNELIKELYADMRYGTLQPKTVVDYIREPFVYGPGNVRVTLDHDIRTGRPVPEFLRVSDAPVPAADGRYILEIKYDSFLPDIVRCAVSLDNRSVCAFSKYASCRAVSQH